MKKRLISGLCLAGLLAFALPACSDEDSPVDGQIHTGTGEAPAIVTISWASSPGCQPGARSNVTITVNVVDPDTDLASLNFGGDVTGCTGAITSSITDISCPNTGQYSGTITVVDPEGNGDMRSFSFGPCESGSTNF